jgi:hypothetical protein
VAHTCLAEAVLGASAGELAAGEQALLVAGANVGVGGALDKLAILLQFKK